jgi:hypothetical protein
MADERSGGDDEGFVDINLQDIPPPTVTHPLNRRIIAPVAKLTRKGSKVLQRGASLLQDMDKKTGTSNAVAHLAIHTAAMILDRPKETKLKRMEGWFALELMIVEKVVEEKQAPTDNLNNANNHSGAAEVPDDTTTGYNNSINNNVNKSANNNEKPSTTFAADDDAANHQEKLESYTMTATGLYMDISEARVRRGAEVILWPKTGGNNQVWRYDVKKHALQSRLNGLLLDINGGSQKANTKVSILGIIL